jgi:hypothetical protein
MTTIASLLLGAITMASFTISLFFLRFWWLTRDRFFFLFAASFCIEGVSRILLGTLPHANEYEPLIYSLRLLGFLVIIYAIADKNRRRKGRTP